jgi:hypothetical protein
VACFFEHLGGPLIQALALIMVCSPRTPYKDVVALVELDSCCISL